jgi:hypothetical protein
MGTRLELQAVLELITPNVYFQPPTKMSYPCILYKRDADDTKWADDITYLHKWRYEVTVIDKAPDSLLVDAVRQLPLCKFTRHFVAENLNHDVYNLFF